MTDQQLPSTAQAMAPRQGVQRNVNMTPAKAIETAGKLFSASKYKEAANLARQITLKHPKLIDASNILAASVASLGDYKEAITITRKLIKSSPNNATLFSNLGEYQRRAGKNDEAQKTLQRAIELQPNNYQAYNNLGIVYFEGAEFDKAVESYEKALGISPNYAESHNNLGNAFRALGKNEEAIGCYQRALAMREIYPEAYNNLGTALREKDLKTEAEHAYRKAISQRPSYIEASVNLAGLLNGNDQSVEALRVLADALRIDDKHPGALLMTARVQVGRNNHEQAQKAVQIVLNSDPDNAEAMVISGQILHDQDQYDEAVEVLEKAVQINPKNSEAQNFLGVVLKSVGRLDEARAALLEGHRLTPKNWATLANLNDLLDFSEHPDLVAEMEAGLKDADDPSLSRYIALHYAYAKALDDMGKPEAAIDEYLIGATAKRRDLDYNEEKSIEFFNQIETVFTKEFIQSIKYKGDPDARPVFIIGMPRSGSTLVEQILSSHPDVFGAGEVKYLSRSLHLLRDRFPGIPVFPEMAKQMEDAQFDYVSKNYIEQVASQAGNAQRITDKLLTNYFFVGLIHALYPNAHFIHTRRNPVDTCLSAFTKLFKDDMPHSYEFSELGRYYKRYEKLMAHWENVLPKGKIMTMDYEKVVSDLDTSARGLIDFLGLPFDERCLSFHESDRPVKTASVVQVRQPVYKTSVERWRKYGTKLQPLLDALDYKG